MYGAILGDMIGSPYEFKDRKKDKDFPLFCEKSRFTDDSAMTIAIADALLRTAEQDQWDDEAAVKDHFIDCMHEWGRKYPNAGYGGRFFKWLMLGRREPYGSYGNGSGMRVSPAGWVSDSLEETRKLARWSAEVTHDHPEGVKGAEAIVSAVWMSRHGSSKDEIRAYINEEFSYDLERTCDEIRPDYDFDVSCQGSVPESIISFLESDGFEDAIRNGVSLGGDSDTIGAMTGSIAEAFYGVPEDLKQECEKRLPEDMVRILRRFSDRYSLK